MRQYLLITMFLFLLAGCDAADSGYSSRYNSEPHSDMAGGAVYVDEIGGYEMSSPNTKSSAVIDSSASMVSTVAAGDLDNAAAVQRKIIYTADLQIVIEDFEGIDAKIDQLIAEAGGYKSSVNISSNTGTRRNGTWVARVPVETYTKFLDAVSELGVPVSIRQQTDDVTTRFIDVEARLETKKELETRIRALVQEREGKIGDVMEVERELARVRGEIESLEGELRYLANQSALSTVTINIREEQDYEPPQAPSFGGRIAHTWGASLINLKKAGQALVLLGVGFAPWLAVMFIVLLPVGILWRNRRKRKAA